MKARLANWERPKGADCLGAEAVEGRADVACSVGHGQPTWELAMAEARATGDDASDDAGDDAGAEGTMRAFVLRPALGHDCHFGPQPTFGREKLWAATPWELRRFGALRHFGVFRPFGAFQCMRLRLSGEAVAATVICGKIGPR